jgi:hypothetical protein
MYSCEDFSDLKIRCQVAGVLNRPLLEKPTSEGNGCRESLEQSVEFGCLFRAICLVQWQRKPPGAKAG